MKLNDTTILEKPLIINKINIMNHYSTIEKMKQMRLKGMAEVYYNNMQASSCQDYTIDQYLAMLVDYEWESRQERKIMDLLLRLNLRLRLQ